jgi:hypothetical protein
VAIGTLQFIFETFQTFETFETFETIETFVTFETTIYRFLDIENVRNEEITEIHKTQSTIP